MGLNNKNITGADELISKMNAAKHYLQTDVYEVVGTEAVKHFKKNFDEEGFVDSSVQKWKSRKTKRAGSTNGQKVLSKSGELADSIVYRTQIPSVIISTDKPYAQLQNEGGEIEVTPKMKKYFWAMNMQAKQSGDTEMAEQYKFMALAKKITIPKRQYIGESTVMNDNIIAKINRDLNNILK